VAVPECHRRPVATEFDSFTSLLPIPHPRPLCFPPLLPAHFDSTKCNQRRPSQRLPASFLGWLVGQTKEANPLAPMEGK
jgi:hypothetical protein